MNSSASSQEEMPPAALTRTPGPTSRASRPTSPGVAPPVEKPVEVLIKSAPAWVTIRHISTFSSRVRRQVSMMTFSTRSPQAALTAFTSSSTSGYFLSRSHPRLITMSISAAPFPMASLVSNTLAAVVVFPFGKPTTVQTGTLPPRYPAAWRT